MLIFNIKNIRLTKNLSIYKLSKMTGLSRRYLRDIENNINTNPTVAVLNRIATALDVNVKELFYSELDIEDLKLKMYEKIDEFGINSKEVLEISRIIDLLLNINNPLKTD